MIPRSLTLLLAGLSVSWAATYHFAADGDDSRTPSQAGSAATPWKTLAQLGTVRVNPGDTILLRRGDTWREPITIKRSGTLESPVVISIYGSGTEKAELRGTVLLAGTSSGGQFSAKVANGAPVKAVFADGARMRCARFPDTGWIKASAIEGHGALSSDAVAGRDWVGASIHLRTSVWTLETHRVLSQEGARLVLDTKTVNILPDSVQFFLTNHVSALPSASGPAWAFSSSDSTLRWTGPTASVEAAVLPTLLDITGYSHVRASGLRLFGSTFQAVKLNGTGLHVTDFDIVHPGLTGVMVKGRWNRFERSRVYAAANTAVSGIGVQHTIESNVIRRTAQLADFGPDGMGDGCCGGRAIDFSADSTVIMENDIDSTGYIGIGFKGLSNLVIRNVVARSCMTTDDCAGIYTYAGKYANAGAAGGIVRRNFVHSSVGGAAGIPKPSDASVGIYLDDGSQDILVDSNVVWDNGKGIFLHNTQRVTLRGNIAFDNRLTQLLMVHDGLAGVGDMSGNLIHGNLLVAFPGQGADAQSTIQQLQAQPLAEMEGNTICSYQVLSTRCWNETSELWKKTTLVAGDPRLGPETQANGGFDEGIQSWISWPAEAVYSLDSGANCAGGRCLKLSYRGVSPTINPLFHARKSLSVVKGQAMLLTFRARSQRPGQNLVATLRRGTGDYAVLGFMAAVRLDTTWTSHSILLRANETASDARLDFRNSYTDSVYWIDDISVRSVPESLLVDPTPPMLLRNPPPTRPPTIEGISWMDAWGTSRSTDEYVAPWQAKVVFPYPGLTASVPGRPTKPSLRAIRTSDGWRFEGLRGSARILDLRGRTLATLHPDPQGRASWKADPQGGMRWLQSGRESRVLIGAN